MSNQVIIDIRHFSDDVLVLAEDNYGRTYRSYEPDEFHKRFPTVKDLLVEVSAFEELDGAFVVNEEKREVILETCNSVEVHGFNNPDDGTVLIITDEASDEEAAIFTNNES